MKTPLPLLLLALLAAPVLADSLCRAPAAPCVWTAAYEYKREPVRPDDPAQARLFDRMQLVLPRPKLRTRYAWDGGKREVTQWAGGRQTETWTLGGFQLFTKPNFPEGEVEFREADSGPGPGPRETDFPELAWLRPELRAGKVSYQGTEADHYVLPARRKPGEEAGASGPPQAEAWVDARTGFPLALENAAFRVAYQSLKRAPTADETALPPAFAALWEKMARSGVRPATPPPAGP